MAFSAHARVLDDVFGVASIADKPARERQRIGQMRHDDVAEKLGCAVPIQ